MFHENNNNENMEGRDDHMYGKMGMMMRMPKEFKLAMLEKKEKILEAKLEFIGKLKELIMKSSEDKK